MLLPPGVVNQRGRIGFVCAQCHAWAEAPAPSFAEGKWIVAVAMLCSNECLRRWAEGGDDEPTPTAA